MGRTWTHLDRPGLDRLRNLASEGTFEAVLISSPNGHLFAARAVRA